MIFDNFVSYKYSNIFPGLNVFELCSQRLGLKVKLENDFMLFGVIWLTRKKITYTLTKQLNDYFFPAIMD